MTRIFISVQSIGATAACHVQHLDRWHYQWKCINQWSSLRVRVSPLWNNLSWLFNTLPPWRLVPAPPAHSVLYSGFLSCFVCSSVWTLWCHPSLAFPSHKEKGDLSGVNRLMAGEHFVPGISTEVNAASAELDMVHGLFLCARRHWAQSCEWCAGNFSTTTLMADRFCMCLQISPAACLHHLAFKEGASRWERGQNGNDRARWRHGEGTVVI